MSNSSLNLNSTVKFPTVPPLKHNQEYKFDGASLQRTLSDKSVESSGSFDDYVKANPCKFSYPEIEDVALSDPIPQDAWHSVNYTDRYDEFDGRIQTDFVCHDLHEFGQYNMIWGPIDVSKRTWALNVLDDMVLRMFGKRLNLINPTTGDLIVLLNNINCSVAGVDYYQLDFGFGVDTLAYEYKFHNDIKPVFSTKSFTVYMVMETTSPMIRASKIISANRGNDAIWGFGTIFFGIFTYLSTRWIGLATGFESMCTLALFAFLAFATLALYFFWSSFDYDGVQELQVGPRHSEVVVCERLSWYEHMFRAPNFTRAYFPNVLINKSVAATSGVRDLDSAKRKISSFVSRLANDFEGFSGFSRYISPLRKIFEMVWETHNKDHAGFSGLLPRPIYGKCQGVAKGVETKPGSKLYTSLSDDQCDDDEIRGWQYFAANVERLYVPKNCVHNAQKALVNRILKKFKDPSKLQMIKLKRFVQRMLPKLVPVSQVDLAAYDKWREHCNAKQRGRYNHIDYEANMDICVDYLRVKGFVKYEFHFKEDFIGRIISGRTDEYATQLGPYTYTASKILQACWNYKDDINCPYAEVTPNNLCNKILYAAGHNRDSMGEWMNNIMENFDKPLFLSTDYSKYDAHISTLHLLIEQALYEYLYPGDDDLLALVRSQLFSAGVISTKTGKLTYKVLGTRKSGDPNTSVGNSFLNAMMQLFALNHFIDVEQALESGVLRMAVMGDDTIIATDGYYVDQAQYAKVLASIGMEADLSYGDITQVKFCSSMFVPCKRTHDQKMTYLMSPLPGRQLIKAGCSVHKYMNKSIGNWILTNAMSNRDDFSCLPWISCFFDRQYKAYAGYKHVSQFVEKHWSTAFRYDAVESTKQWWLSRYGMAQDDLVKLWRQLDSDVPNLEHPVVRILYDVDVGADFPNQVDLSSFKKYTFRKGFSDSEDAPVVNIKVGDLRLKNTAFNDRGLGRTYFPKPPVVPLARPKNYSNNPHKRLAQRLMSQYNISHRIGNKISRGKGSRMGQRHAAKLKTKWKRFKKERRSADFVSSVASVTSPK